jgi:hypothetical protein
MSKRIQVSIVKETKKALLVRAQGTQLEGWIQRRWFDAETSTVAASTFDRAVAARAEYVAAARAERDAEREFREGYHALPTPARETERALGFRVGVAVASSLATTRMIWIPRSVLRDGMAPGWILIAKAREIIADVDGGGVTPWVDDDNVFGDASRYA